MASPQLRECCLLVLAGAFDVHDCVACNSSLALQFGSELDRRAEFDIIPEKLIIDWIGPPFDDDVVWLEHEPRDHTVVAAAAEWERHSGEKNGEDAPTY